LRIIWGGDETVSAIRLLPAKPTTKDITFTDKISYGVINSSIYLTANAKQKIRLASAFYSDAYMFNQMGCSSPRIVYFAGKAEENERASQEFWELLKAELGKRHYSDDISVANNKLVETYFRATGEVDYQKVTAPAFDSATVVRLRLADIGECRETCGGGFFWECFIDNIDLIVEKIKPGDQTLSYFGFASDELKRFAELIQTRGVDRIVPIGKALDFATVWDGYDLLKEMTRYITID
jgi:hypothetical protein